MNPAIRLWPFLAAPAVLTDIAASADPPAQSDGTRLNAAQVLSLRDGRFHLDGRPFAEISFNKFDLMWSLHGELEAGRVLNDDNTILKAQGNALANLRKLGFRSIRIFAFPWGDGAAEKLDDPERKRRIFEALDKTVALCELHGIGIIWSLSAGSFTNREVSLKQLCGDPGCPNRKRLEDYLDHVIHRYRGSPAVLMWEIHNELTLAADIPEPAGSQGGTVPTLREVAAFQNEIARFIKQRDPLRLVNNGGSSPREFQWNLHLGNGWKRDNHEEQRKCFELVFANSAVDVADIHYYLQQKSGVLIAGDDGRERMIGLADYKAMAASAGKPLMIGEIARSPAAPDNRDVWSAAPDYFRSLSDTQAALPWVRKLLDEIVASEVQLAYWWTYQSDRDMDAHDPMSFHVSVEKNPEIVHAIAGANQRLKRNLGVLPSGGTGD